ncbi:MAG: phytanoyl-CoA dioxygenase family protein [Proteobacteria bacterium]|nr:phytanoyl-CoA dioxygenase family protein [Pseudomonadota bacterium]
MAFPLSSAEQHKYRKEGFVVRPRVFDPPEIDDMRDQCERLIERLVRNRKTKRQKFGSYTFDSDMDNGVIIKWEGDSDVVHGIEPFAHLSLELKTWALDPRFVDPMKDLIGTEAPMLFTEKLNLKRPRYGGVNPLHQDYPYWVQVAQEAKDICTAMLFLDDSTLANGCLHVAPGSHLGGKWQGRADTDRFGSNEIDESIYDDLDLIAVEVPAGSVILFGPMLVHKSLPNTSSKQRRALLFSYQPAGRRTQLEALKEGIRKSP